MASLKQCFISYSHFDYAEFQLGLRHWEASAGAFGYSIWHDDRILPGDYWNNKIQEELDKSQMFILLISNGFFSSSYIKEKELPIIARKSRSERALVVPVLVKESMYKMVLGDYFQPVPARPETPKIPLPVTQWSSIEHAFATALNAVNNQIVEWFGVKPRSQFDPEHNGVFSAPGVAS